MRGILFTSKVCLKDSYEVSPNNSLLNWPALFIRMSIFRSLFLKSSIKFLILFLSVISTIYESIPFIPLRGSIFLEMEVILMGSLQVLPEVNKGMILKGNIHTLSLFKCATNQGMLLYTIKGTINFRHWHFLGGRGQKFAKYANGW